MPAFRGGRCEIFANPSSDIKNNVIRHFDFEGMYHSCLYGRFPVEGLLFSEDVSNLEQPGFYHITVEYYTTFPVLPVKLEKLYFPQGVVSGLYWYEEVRLLLENVEVGSFKINYAWLVRSYEPVFASFATKLQEAKGDPLTAKLVKWLANSFYGRLGLTSELLKTEIAGGGGSEYVEYADLLLTNKPVTVKNLKSNINAAAIITSRARIKLYKALLALKKIKDSRILYTDTDSLIAQFPTESVPDNTPLQGGVFFDTSKPDTCIKDAVFIAPKTYALLFDTGDEVVRIKGIPNPSISFTAFKKAFYNKENIVMHRDSMVREGLTYINKRDRIVVNTQSYTKRL